MEITPKELAAILGATIEGNPDVKLHSFGKLDEAQEGMLTFLANPKYTHQIYTTQASAALVCNDFVPVSPLSLTLIRVADPYKSLADLLNLVEQQKPMPTGIEQPVYIADGVDIPEDAYIGAFAYIGKGAQLGKNVKVYPQVYIGEGAVIGENTILRQGVKVYEGCRIGKDCILHAGVVIGADGFGFAPREDGTYEKIPQTGIVVIEDNVEIGANTTVDRATFGATVVGTGTKLDNLVQVGHNVTIGNHNVICAQSGLAGSTKVGSFNRFAGQSGFSGHITIGDHNTVGAQSGVHKSMGDGETVLGYPAIDARLFAKQAVMLKNLDKIYKKIK